MLKTAYGSISSFHGISSPFYVFVVYLPEKCPESHLLRRYMGLCSHFIGQVVCFRFSLFIFQTSVQNLIFSGTTRACVFISLDKFSVLGFPCFFFPDKCPSDQCGLLFSFHQAKFPDIVLSFIFLKQELNISGFQTRNKFFVHFIKYISV